MSLITHGHSHIAEDPTIWSRMLSVGFVNSENDHLLIFPSPVYLIWMAARDDRDLSCTDSPCNACCSCRGVRTKQGTENLFWVSHMYGRDLRTALSPAASWGAHQQEAGLLPGQDSVYPERGWRLPNDIWIMAPKACSWNVLASI